MQNLLRQLTHASLALAGCALLLAGAAQAEPGPQPRSERPRADMRDAQRQDMARAAEEQRRAQAQQEQSQRYEAFRRTGRMTADDRRDLRRQINEAGQDIYANPQGRR